MDARELGQRHVHGVPEHADAGPAQRLEVWNELGATVRIEPPLRGEIGDAPQGLGTGLEGLDPRPSLVHEGAMGHRTTQQVVRGVQQPIRQRAELGRGRTTLALRGAEGERRQGPAHDRSVIGTEA